ncbi:histidine-rich glycoprotein-like [Musca vetustissima]|uniref:histidine-rich glycoprotein-like n=1 Tax=Musca vetustissima TaxID=27455 RepID=UPI002AB699C3|nr:histidine-rich glycoprotein-like [Musca vetustissima]
MAQFVTHIQPTLMEASQGHVPHHHAHQVGVQHSSHLPHSGHNMPSPPTAHNHHQIHHQQHQSNHHGSVSSPPGGHHQHQQHHQQQHHQQPIQQQQHHHSNHGPGKHSGTGGKHEHCPSGHQSSVKT